MGEFSTHGSPQERADLLLRQNEARQAFLLRLSDALRPLGDPIEIQGTAARVLGEYLKVDRVAYGEVLDDDHHIVFERNFVADGVPVITGRFRMEDFGGALLAELRQGRMIAVGSIADELPGPEGLAYAAMGIASLVGAPLIKAGRFVGNLAVHHGRPRAWTELEIGLVRETAERTWGAVQRARAEAALRENEAKYRSLFESMDEGFCIIERVAGDLADFRFLEANPAFAGQAGFTDVPGRTIREVLPGESGEWLETYDRVLRTGSPIRFQRKLQPAGRTLELYAFPLPSHPEERVAVIFKDVTEQKQAEEALRELNEQLEQRVEERTNLIREQGERFRTLVEAAAITVWSADAQGRIVEDSPSWRAFTGQSSEAWLAGRWTEAVHPEDRYAAGEGWSRATGAQRPMNAEFRIWHEESQSWRWTNARAEPLRDARGAVRGWIGMNIDVDERRRAEQARAAALRQLTSAEEQERRRISRELHDQLGQQLTGLQLGLRTMQGAEVPAELAERLRTLERLAAGVSRDLHSIAMELRPAALDSLGLAAAVQNHLEAWGELHGIDYDLHTIGLQGVRLPQEVESTLYRVAQEALTNVLKHAAATRVGVLLEFREGVAGLIVEDDGRGFAVDAVLGLQDASGRLGLQGVRERLALLGGDLQIESVPGNGTTLFVRVPVPHAPGQGT
jgi:PAS domain S-box-containing protein